VLFVAFTGEEMGLMGSAHYVEHPAIPIAETVAMLNLDMVGRLAEGRLTVFGAETSPAFEPAVREAAGGLPLELAFTEGAFAPSDQTSFHAKGVPVLHFFSGTHPQYHTPEDDASLVNPEGIALVARAVARTARALADASERPPVVLAEAPPPSSGEGGYGPWLGSVPAFGGPPVRGVRLQAVRPGSPAEAAGLRAGDVIVEFAGAPVANLEEFAALLFGARAGERVEIVVEREGRRISTSALLGQRR
jgi:membrane-associated protease RseP (regulator of RpoE activity)